MKVFRITCCGRHLYSESVWTQRSVLQFFDRLQRLFAMDGAHLVKREA